MDLESPTETVCPLHAAIGEAHTVELKENKNGKPYFQCETLGCVVNMHKDAAEDYTREVLELTDQTGILAEPDESDESDDEMPTMADLINTENND